MQRLVDQDRWYQNTQFYFIRKMKCKRFCNTRPASCKLTSIHVFTKSQSICVQTFITNLKAACCLFSDTNRRNVKIVLKLRGHIPKACAFTYMQQTFSRFLTVGWGGKPDLNYSEYMGILQTLNHYKDLTIGGGENTSQKALLLRLFS